MYVDIHTHVDNQSVTKIDDDFNGEKTLISIGVHPWDVESFDFSQTMRMLYDFVKNNDVFAIGEVGLDKVHKETFEKQQEVFLEMIRLSESYEKPMIIHCVRAYSEIIETRKRTKARMPWVIHGFSSSVETMQQLLSHGMYISLGEILYRNENQAVKLLKNIPPDRLFLETDVSGRDIRDVYNKAASLMGCEVEFLCRQISVSRLLKTQNRAVF